MPEPDEEAWEAPEEHRHLASRARVAGWILLLAVALLAVLLVLVFIEQGSDGGG